MTTIIIAALVLVAVVVIFVAGIFNFETRDFFQKSSDGAANVPLAKFGAVE